MTFNYSRIRPCSTPLLSEWDGPAIDRNHTGHKKKQITLFPLPNDFWHLLNRTLQPVSLLTTSTLSSSWPGHLGIISLARYSHQWCDAIAPRDSDPGQAYWACLLNVRGVCRRPFVCVCYNSPECNCYESRRIWFALHASRLTELTEASVCLLVSLWECLCSHIQKRLSAGWNSGYSVSLFCHWHLHLCSTNGNSTGGKHQAFHLSSLSPLPSWGLNCNLDGVCVLSDTVTITGAVPLLHNKGQILPLLLNNSETRWTLFSLISGTLCLSMSVRARVCVCGLN